MSRFVRVIPCLDCRDGRVVKGVRFAGLRDVGDPAALAARYARQGADELVLLDVGATPDAKATALATVRAVRAVLPLPLTVGGGVRSADDAALLLDAGADKVAVNSAAVADPELLTRLAERFGAQCVVLAVDAAAAGARWLVTTHGGRRRTEIDAVEFAVEGVARGAGEILLTSLDRDGTGAGYDLALIAAIARRVGVPVIASGGAATPHHLADAIDAGAAAVLVASLLHDHHTTVPDLKRSLAARGIPSRP
jgi:imidazole glycerol-phosphate synthase subunit HisF